MCRMVYAVCMLVYAYCGAHIHACSAADCVRVTVIAWLPVSAAGQLLTDGRVQAGTDYAGTLRPSSFYILDFCLITVFAIKTWTANLSLENVNKSRWWFILCLSDDKENKMWKQRYKGVVKNLFCERFPWIDVQVTRQVSKCRCPKRFQVEQIGDNKYRVRSGVSPHFGLGSSKLICVFNEVTSGNIRGTCLVKISYHLRF